MMRTDFVRKHAAFSAQNPAQQTPKRKEFCRLLYIYAEANQLLFSPDHQYSHHITYTKTGSGQTAGTCVILYNKAYIFIESALSALNLLPYLHSKKVL